MAYTTINKQTDFFNTLLYAGNDGTGRSITGVGFQPDFVWIKDRSNAINHSLFDAARGATKELNSNANTAEETEADMLTAFGTDGFTLNSAGGVNGNNNNYVSWNWKGGTTSGLSGGTITPSSYSINATSGFGVYKYTGNSTSGATIAHGLGKVPTMILVKRLDSAKEWQIYHVGVGNNKWLEFTNGTPQTGTSRWNDTTPTSTLFYLGNDSDVNYNGASYVAYVFCNVTGYSKMGSYTGNGNANGTFIYTGFKPQFVIFRNIAITQHWLMMDTKRDPFNVMDTRLYPSQNNADTTNAAYYVDYLSNGIKIRSDSVSWNASGNNIIYMAFGQSIVGTNNVAATAR